MSDPRLDLIPDADQLRAALAAPGGSDIAVIEVDGHDPFYVELDKDGSLVVLV